MSEEQIKAVLIYIRTHMPQETEFKTIDVAINSVAKEINAATKEDLVNRDDAWLVPDEERDKFAGIRGRGWAQSFSSEMIGLFKEAVQYAKEHASEYQKTGGVSIMSDDKEKLKQIRNELMNNIPSDNNYSNSNDRNDYDKYMGDSDINKIVR